MNLRSLGRLPGAATVTFFNGTAVLAVCATFACVAGCSHDSTSEARSTVPPTTADPAELRPWPCPIGTPTSARCNRVEVPTSWSDPTADTLTIPVVVVPATTDDRRPDPLVVLTGGPGGSITEVAEYWSDPHRDIVLYDQRGAGRAEPRLDCLERDRAWLANLQQDAGFVAERTALAEATSSCRRRLEASGIDLDDYDTEASVRDLDAIRRALGYERWNVLGISYGARLALAALRSSPGGIRSVILDSVSDVTTGGLAARRAAAERALDQLVAGCAENKACRVAHPDLTVEIDIVEKRYDATPIVIDVAVDDTSSPETFVITGADVLAGISQAMYDATLIPPITRLIWSLAAGDTAFIPELIRQNVAFHRSIAWGTNLSVDCADVGGLGAEDDEAVIADPGRFRTLLTETTCADDWPVEPTANDFNSPVTSDVPALVVAGQYDPVTPPAGSEQVASRLTNSTFALWTNLGHGVTGDACAEELMAAFLEHPGWPLNAECLAAISAPAFV